MNFRLFVLHLGFAFTGIVTTMLGPLLPVRTRRGIPSVDHRTGLAADGELAYWVHVIIVATAGAAAMFLLMLRLIGHPLGET